MGYFESVSSNLKAGVDVGEGDIGGRKGELCRQCVPFGQRAHMGVKAAP